MTGTSPGSGTGLDIATVALHTIDGDPADTLWPSDGVRRYNHDLENGDDRAVELGGVSIVSDEGQPDLLVVVLGTSWGGEKDDDYTTHLWSSASTDPLWDSRYDGGVDDVARGLWVDSSGLIYVTGYSRDASNADLEIATVSYDATGARRWVARWDHADDHDVPNDLHVYDPPTGDRQVWVTGSAVDGSEAGVAIVRYLDPGGASSEWTDVWSTTGGIQYARAMTVFGGEPYITGSLIGSTGGSFFDRMLALKYVEDSPYMDDWSRIYSGGGSFSGGTDHEGRGAVVAVIDGSGNRNIYITGVSKVTGEGRQFTTWRYEED